MFKLFKRQTNQQQSDDELLRSYQASGDMEVLGLLFERYVELVYGVCLKFFKDPVKSEDAVMNIFESLIEKAKTHDIRQFRPWLHVVAKNHCLMQLRKKQLTVSYEDLSPSAMGDLVQSSEAVHPSYDLEVDAEEEALRRCIERLAERQRKCVQQFYFEDLSYKEIADQTGEELGMVRSYIQNGRRNLRICMEKEVKSEK